jgi:alkylation response protein AidB-like acyl-CoA dehydrogenase
MVGQGMQAGMQPAARVAAISDVIEANIDALERDRRMSPALLDALHAQRLFRMLLPKPYGGEEAAPLDFMAGIEALARYDGSLAWCVCQGNGCAMTAAYVAPEAAAEIWGQDPRAVVAWGPGKAEAIETEGGYTVSGSLMFASGGRHATWLGAHSAVKTADGEVRPGEIRTFLMPAGSIEMHDIWNVIGLRGTASDGYTLDKVFVPAERTTLRDDPDGRKIVTPLYNFPAMSMFALGFGSVALGIAQGFLGDFLAFAQGKRPPACEINNCG